MCRHMDDDARRQFGGAGTRIVLGTGVCIHEWRFSEAMFRRLQQLLHR